MLLCGFNYGGPRYDGRARPGVVGAAKMREGLRGSDGQKAVQVVGRSFSPPVTEYTYLGT